LANLSYLHLENSLEISWRFLKEGTQEISSKTRQYRREISCIMEIYSSHHVEKYSVDIYWKVLVPKNEIVKLSNTREKSPVFWQISAPLIWRILWKYPACRDWSARGD